jgi:hypothetical protein
MSLERLRRAKAVITSPVGEQPIGVVDVGLHALGLPVGAVRAADVYALVPLQAHPTQVLEDRLLRFAC